LRFASNFSRPAPFTPLKNPGKEQRIPHHHCHTPAEAKPLKLSILEDRSAIHVEFDEATGLVSLDMAAFLNNYSLLKTTLRLR
jgi:hypothetical protein